MCRSKEGSRKDKRDKKQVWIQIGRDLKSNLLGTRKLIYHFAKNYRKESALPLNAVKEENGELLIVSEEIGRR